MHLSTPPVCPGFATASPRTSTPTGSGRPLPPVIFQTTLRARSTLLFPPAKASAMRSEIAGTEGSPRNLTPGSHPPASDVPHLGVGVFYVRLIFFGGKGREGVRSAAGAARLATLRWSDEVTEPVGQAIELQAIELLAQDEALDRLSDAVVVVARHHAVRRCLHLRHRRDHLSTAAALPRKRVALEQGGEIAPLAPHCPSPRPGRHWTPAAGRLRRRRTPSPAPVPGPGPRAAAAFPPTC